MSSAEDSLPQSGGGQACGAEIFADVWKAAQGISLSRVWLLSHHKVNSIQARCSRGVGKVTENVRTQ